MRWVLSLNIIHRHLIWTAGHWIGLRLRPALAEYAPRLVWGQPEGNPHTRTQMLLRLILQCLQLRSLCLGLQGMAWCSWVTGKGWGVWAQLPTFTESKVKVKPTCPDRGVNLRGMATHLLSEWSMLFQIFPFLQHAPPYPCRRKEGKEGEATRRVQNIQMQRIHIGSVWSVSSWATWGSSEWLTRWTNSSGFGGKSKLITLSIRGMSIPRAATSVVMSSWTCRR
jgi:hypothetical protein